MPFWVISVVVVSLPDFIMCDRYVIDDKRVNNAKTRGKRPTTI